MNRPTKRWGPSGLSVQSHTGRRRSEGSRLVSGSYGSRCLCGRMMDGSKLSIKGASSCPSCFKSEIHRSPFSNWTRSTITRLVKIGYPISLRNLLDFAAPLPFGRLSMWVSRRCPMIVRQGSRSTTKNCVATIPRSCTLRYLTQCFAPKLSPLLVSRARVGLYSEISTGQS